MSNDTKPQKEQFAQCAFPLGGIDAEQPFDLQPQGTTPSAVNVCSVDPTTNRARGGSRPGLGRFLPPLATRGVIQHLQIIVDPQADALTADFGDLPFGDLIQFEWIDDPTTGTNRYGRARNLGQVKKGGTGRETGFSISKSPTMIIWADPDDMTAGDPLSSTQLNAVAVEAPGGFIPVAGTMAYSPASGTVLSTGRATLKVTFTPTDTGFYKGAVGTAHVNVGDASPPPASLTYEFSASSQTSSPDTTLTRTIAVNAGDLLLVFTGGSDFSAGQASVTFAITDNQTNSYTHFEAFLTEDNGFSHYVLGAFWAKAASTGTLTVTSTATQSVNYAMIVHRISGQHPTSPIRDSSANSAHSPSTPSVATTTLISATNGDMVFAQFLGSPLSFTPLAPFTDFLNVSASGAGVSGRHAVASAAESGTATNNSGSYVAIGVAIAPLP